MRKKGKKNIFILFGVCTFLLAGILITAQGDTINQIREKIASSLGNNADKYVERFIEEKKINTKNIKSVSEIDFENLPPEINIGEIRNADLSIYRVDFNDISGESDKVFVVRYVPDGLEIGKPIPPKNVTFSPEETPEITPRLVIPKFLNFESTSEMDKSGFLDSLVEITGSMNKGYTMVGDGNIINLSTHIEVYEGEGTVGITLYKNGVRTSITNSFAVGPGKLVVNPNTKSYFIYTITSKGTISFKKGDVLSVYVTLSDGVTIRSITSSAKTG